MLAASGIMACDLCGARLARDHVDTICSPCRRTGIESSARTGALIVRDRSQIKAVFDSYGVYGVADHLGCTPEEGLDVLFSAQLLPPVSQRRHGLLRHLVALRDRSHVAVAESLNISRWTVATYRQLLGIERPTAQSTRPRKW